MMVFLFRVVDDIVAPDHHHNYDSCQENSNAEPDYIDSRIQGRFQEDSCHYKRGILQGEVECIGEDVADIGFHVFLERHVFVV